MCCLWMQTKLYSLSEDDVDSLEPIIKYNNMISQFKHFDNFL